MADTKGMDQDYQVVLFKPQEHADMIRLFFATKVWVLNENYSVP